MPDFTGDVVFSQTFKNVKVKADSLTQAIQLLETLSYSDLQADFECDEEVKAVDVISDDDPVMQGEEEQSV